MQRVNGSQSDKRQAAMLYRVSLHTSSQTGGMDSPKLFNNTTAGSGAWRLDTLHCSFEELDFLLKERFSHHQTSIMSLTSVCVCVCVCVQPSVPAVLTELWALRAA